MSKLLKISIIVSVFAFTFAFNPNTVKADDNEFDLSVKHNINGKSLGLDKNLPVDVYVDGSYVFTFTFGETVEATLPAGDYFIEVNLAGTGTTVMELQTGDVPADVDVMIKAQLSGFKTPVLKVKVK